MTTETFGLKPKPDALTLEGAADSYAGATSSVERCLYELAEAEKAFNEAKDRLVRAQSWKSQARMLLLALAKGETNAQVPS